MRTPIKKALGGLGSVALFGGLLLAGPADAAHAPGTTETYTATLTELNGSGTSAEVMAVRNGSDVTMTMTVTGAEPGLFHAQHIHGSLEGGNTCPPPEADTDEDGFVSVVEGVPFYGGIQATLSTGPDFTPDAALTGPFPTAGEDGTYTYTETFSLPGETAAALDNLHIVVHGIDIDDSGAYDGDKPSSLTPDVPFEVTVPAACGELVEADPAGVVQSYAADLDSLNNSGTTGEVYAQRVGNQVTVAMEIEGAEPGLFHAQHIHGEIGVSNGCPPPSADTDDDGFVSVVEGIPFYGSIQATLATGDDFTPASALTGPFPTTGEDGTYSYIQTFTVTDEVAADLGNLHIVIHGIDIDDSGAYDGDKPSSLTDDVPFEVTVPAACGALSLTALNPGDDYVGAEGQQGSIVRTYLVLLDRAPDADGFAYFDNEIDNGASLEDLSWSVAVSEEFQARFGDAFEGTTDGEWVDFVYAAVFERSADAEGRDYWIGELESGRADRVTMLVYFAESQEFKNVTSTS